MNKSSMENKGNNDKHIVVRSATGYSQDGDDMQWIVACPECEKEFEYEGYFDSTRVTECTCGCTFTTSKVWLDDEHYIQ